MFDIDSILKEINNQIYVKNAEKFSLYYDLLCEYNKMCNLTTIVDKKEAYVKHFVDSLISYQQFENNSSVIEIGSGGGFPSIPLKIVREDLDFTLVEATRKKCTFLNQVINKLQLKKIKVINDRAEILSKTENHREKYDYAVARAVARLNSLNEYCLPFVKVGGKFFAYKSDNCEEIDEGRNSVKILGGKISNVYKYSLPEDMGDRNIIEIEKILNTPEKYPRGQGKERSKPL